MKKERSKQKFFNKLSFLLSFYFNNTESTSILNDYRNLFENEASQGKTEDEICSDLEPPIKIVKKLSSQTSSNSSKLFIFSHNIILHYTANFISYNSTSIYRNSLIKDL